MHTSTCSFHNSFVPRTICNWNLFASLVYLYHPLKVALGHTCKISHCCYIVCPLLLLHNLELTGLLLCKKTHIEDMWSSFTALRIIQAGSGWSLMTTGFSYIAKAIITLNMRCLTVSIKLLSSTNLSTVCEIGFTETPQKKPSAYTNYLQAITNLSLHCMYNLDLTCKRT